MSPSNIALYITSIGWVIILNLGVVIVTMSLSPPSGYGFGHHGAYVDASYVTYMSQFLYRFHAAYPSHHSPLFSCSKEVEARVSHSSVILTLHVVHSRYCY